MSVQHWWYPRKNNHNNHVRVVFFCLFWFWFINFMIKPIESIEFFDVIFIVYFLLYHINLYYMCVRVIFLFFIFIRYMVNDNPVKYSNWQSISFIPFSSHYYSCLSFSFSIWLLYGMWSYFMHFLSNFFFCLNDFF